MPAFQAPRGTRDLLPATIAPDSFGWSGSRPTSLFDTAIEASRRRCSSRPRSSSEASAAPRTSWRRSCSGSSRALRTARSGRSAPRPHGGHRPRLHPAQHAHAAAADPRQPRLARCSGTTARRPALSTASSWQWDDGGDPGDRPAIDAEKLIELEGGLLPRRRPRERRGAPEFDRGRRVPAGVPRAPRSVLPGARLGAAGRRAAAPRHEPAPPARLERPRRWSR